MNRVITYFKESWRELGKISWPNRELTTRLTIAVIIFSAILGIFITVVDLGLVRVVEKVILK